jgi:hypothetical protein
MAVQGLKPKMANLYSGIIKKEAIADGRGQSYKIRLTNQIRNLIKMPIRQMLN